MRNVRGNFANPASRSTSYANSNIKSALSFMMKNFSVITFLIMLSIILTACDKDDVFVDKYKRDVLTNDTTFYISYEINHVRYKYYQVNSGGALYPSILMTNTKRLMYYERRIEFDYLLSDPSFFNHLHPAFRISFWNTHIYEINSVDSGWYHFSASPMSDELVLNKNYEYYCPPESPQLKDSIYMNGISIEDYTENVMNSFDFDKASIDGFYSDKNKFRITKKTAVERGYYLLNGEFSMRGKDHKNETIDIENGRFYIVIK